MWSISGCPAVWGAVGRLVWAAVSGYGHLQRSRMSRGRAVPFTGISCPHLTNPARQGL